MKKAVLIGAGLWIMATLLVVAVFDPSPTLRHVSFVFVIWYWSGVANWALIGVMLGPCALTMKQVRRGLKGERIALASSEDFPVGTEIRWAEGEVIHYAILRNGLEESIARGSQHRVFWVGYWGSFVALVVNTLAPLVLLAYLPVWTVLGIEALNVALNTGAVPFRIWVWRSHARSIAA